MDGIPSAPAPIACMLEASDFKDRVDWIAALNRDALLSSRRDDLRLELTYAPYALGEVREMVHREQQCCTFLKFELRDEPDAVRLVVTAPEDARDAAELAFEPFQSKSAAASAAPCGASRVASNERGHDSERRPLA